MSMRLYSSFIKNNNGRFDLDILKREIHAVDRYNNPCEVKNGKVTRKYNQGGQIPSYADILYENIYRIGNYRVGLNKEAIKVLATIELDPPQVYPSKVDYRTLGIIDENGKLKGDFPKANESLADGYLNRITIDGDGNVLGHEGAIFDGEGHRIFVNEYNEVDELQTKLYLLFDYIIKQIYKCYDEYANPEYCLSYNYYVKGKNGLSIEYQDYENDNYLLNNYLLNIGIYPSKEFSCSLISYPNGKIGGWLLLSNKKVPISQINYSEEIERVLEKILNEVSTLTIDEERLYACEDNEEYNIKNNKHK